MSLNNLFSEEIEQQILGSIIYDSNVLVEMSEYLNPKYFHFEKHQLIALSINELISKSEPIDLITVVAQLRKKSNLIKSGNASYISELTSIAKFTNNFHFHFRILQQFFVKRELHIDSEKTILEIDLQNVDVFDLLDKRQKTINEISSFLNSNINVDKSQLLKDFEERNKILLSNNGVTGVPSGFMSIDMRTGGYQKGDLIIIAARPGMGKTAYALENALNAVLKFNIPIGFFSLEMSASKIFDRAISSMTGLTLDAITKKGLDKVDESMALTHGKLLVDSCFHIDDKPALTIQELRSKARKMKNDYKIEMIIIDYLQLMQGEKGGNREQEISSISRNLKTIAKELNIPIIALAQLSRSVETRGGEKKPMLSDLRESGAIEQDADMVKFIYRPEYYGIFDSEGVSMKGIAQIIIAKNRNGALDDFSLRFDAERVKFKGIDDDYFSKLESEKPFQKIGSNENF